MGLKDLFVTKHKGIHSPKKKNTMAFTTSNLEGSALGFLH